jgi:xanthine/uracil permease
MRPAVTRGSVVVVVGLELVEVEVEMRVGRW